MENIKKLMEGILKKVNVKFVFLTFFIYLCITNEIVNIV